MKIIKQIVMILFVVVSLGFLQVTAFSQTTADDLMKRRIKTSFSNAYMLEILSCLVVDFKIPVGIEWATDYDEEVQNSMYLENGSIKWKPGKINIVAGTLKEVLDALVRQNQNYKWEVVDGVVNIYPVKLRNDFVKELLNTKIKHFSLFIDDEKFKIRDAILDLPEIQTSANSLKIETFKRYYAYKRSDTSQPNQISELNDVTLKEVLNATVQLTENKMWSIKIIGEDKNNLDLTF